MDITPKESHTKSLEKQEQMLQEFSRALAKESVQRQKKADVETKKQAAVAATDATTELFITPHKPPPNAPSRSVEINQSSNSVAKRE